MTRDVTPLVEAWLHEPAPLSDRGITRVGELVHQTPQRRGLLPRLDIGRLPSMLTATKFVTAGVIVALFSGALYLGITPPPPEEAPLNAAASPSPAPTLEATATPSPEPSVEVSDTGQATPARFALPKPLPRSTRNVSSGKVQTPLGPARWIHVMGTAENLPDLDARIVRVPGGYAGIEAGNHPSRQAKLWFSPDLVKWKTRPLPAETNDWQLAGTDSSTWLASRHGCSSQREPTECVGARLWHSTDARTWEQVDLSGLAPPEPTLLDWTMMLGDVAALGDRLLIPLTFQVWDMAPWLGLESLFTNPMTRPTLKAAPNGEYEVSDGWGTPVARIRFEETADGLRVIDARDETELTTIAEFGMDFVERWAESESGAVIRNRLALVDPSGATFAEAGDPATKVTTRTIDRVDAVDGKFYLFTQQPDGTVQPWRSVDGNEWQPLPVPTDRAGTPLTGGGWVDHDGARWSLFSDKEGGGARRWVSDDLESWRREPNQPGDPRLGGYGISLINSALQFEPISGGNVLTVKRWPPMLRIQPNGRIRLAGDNVLASFQSNENNGNRAMLLLEFDRLAD